MLVEPLTWPEDKIHYDNIMRRAALQTEAARQVGGEAEIRARYSYVAIVALLLDAVEVDTDDREYVDAYIRQKYQSLTEQPYPYKTQISRALASFCIRSRHWDPKPDELALAILEHDPRVEFLAV